MLLEDASAAFNPQMMFDFPDPYPMFADMRRNSPVVTFQALNRLTTLVTRYDDVRNVLKDSDTFSSRANAKVSKFFGRSILEMDGKEHDRTRGLVSRVFVPRSLDALESTVAGLVHELIDAFAERGRTDLVQGLTTAFPVQVIALIIGIPRSEHRQFMRWTVDLIAFSKDPAKGRETSRALYDYFLPQVQERRSAPRDDVMTKLVSGKLDSEQGLADDEVINFLRLLLPAGAETTSRLMGSMFYALLTERARYERVRADRALVPWAIEETLRWETPVPFVPREATRDTEIAGVKIGKGQIVSPVIGSANRDETHFPDPDTYDLDRRADDHVSFGFGRHFCLGYHLAKLEARTALNIVLDRLPRLRLDPDAPPPSVTGLAFRSPQALPVRFD